jgi:hypothetical protein
VQLEPGMLDEPGELRDRPQVIGNEAWVWSKAWMDVFSSIHSTTAFSGWRHTTRASHHQADRPLPRHQNPPRP